jgi:hypothetical protein
MTYDPMRQGDVARRLANMAAAPRCSARARAGSPCKQAAVKGRRRCRMHGGAHGSGGPLGKRNGNYCRGRFTKRAAETKRWVRGMLEQANAASAKMDEALAALQASPREQGAK